MSITEASLRQRAYRYLHQKIITGELPPGSKVSEQAIAEVMGISRTPVRAAIHELESEGLLEQVPRYGTIVRQADRRDIEELYDLRTALEGFAAAEAAKQMSADDLLTLTTLCNAMYEQVEEHRSRGEFVDDSVILSRFVDADMQFHVIILRSTGNRRLMQSVVGSRMLAECGRQARQQPRIDWLAEAWQGHRQILSALQAGDSVAAWQGMVDHIRFSKLLAIKIFDRLQAEHDADHLIHHATARIV